MSVIIACWICAVSLLSAAGKKKDSFYFLIRPTRISPHEHDVTLTHTDTAAEEMLDIPGGKMLMGTRAADGRDGESNTKEVTVTPFKLDKYPVTNADFR